MEINMKIYFYMVLVILLYFLIVPKSLISKSLTGRVIKVGPGQQFIKPSQVAEVAQNGDTILIKKGIYEKDAAVWRANNLTIRGVDGRTHIEADGANAEGKAIWVIKGENTTVQNIEFSGARVSDGNGAGIRQEGKNLKIKGQVFPGLIYYCFLFVYRCKTNLELRMSME